MPTSLLPVCYSPGRYFSQVLEGLEPVRKRPGMYIGSTGPRGLHHLLWEVLDNAVDEVQGGFADAVAVEVDLASCSVSVEDNGRRVAGGAYVRCIGCTGGLLCLVAATAVIVLCGVAVWCCWM
jgi:hypothetical protein